MKILILFAHPAFHKSHVNHLLVEDIKNLKGVTFHDLYERYPEFDIDVKHEQDLLVQHDCIVFHHPFFWYSTPAILKEWQDLVLEHGWAYGSNGNALKGKLFFNLITTGGPKQAYKEGGFNNYSMNELLAPLNQTARLCKMNPLPPFVVHGTHAIEPYEIQKHKKDCIRLLNLIVDDQLDIDKILLLDYLNDYLKEEENSDASR